MIPDGAPNHFFASFRHALDGIRATAHGRNFRVQAALGAVTFGYGCGGSETAALKKR